MWSRYPLCKFLCLIRNIQLTCKRPVCSGGRNCQSGPQSRWGNQPGVHGDVNISVFYKTGKQFGNRTGLPTRRWEIMQNFFLQEWENILELRKTFVKMGCDPSLFHDNISPPGKGLSPGPLHCERPWSRTFFYKTIFFLWMISRFSTFPFFLHVCSGVPKIYDLTFDCFKSQLSKPSSS